MDEGRAAHRLALVLGVERKRDGSSSGGTREARSFRPAAREVLRSLERAVQACAYSGASQLATKAGRITLATLRRITRFLNRALLHAGSPSHWKRAQPGLTRWTERH